MMQLMVFNRETKQAYQQNSKAQGSKSKRKKKRTEIAKKKRKEKKKNTTNQDIRVFGNKRECSLLTLFS